MSNTAATIVGNVVLHGDRNFRGPGEILQDHGQLPFFLPRVDWPDPPHHGIYLSDALKDDYDWKFAQGQRDAERDYEAVFPNLTPMKPFKTVTAGQQLRAQYKGRSWVSHVVALYQILRKHLGANGHAAAQFPGKEPLHWQGMSALCRIASYGMSDSMSIVGLFGLPSSKNLSEAVDPAIGIPLTSSYPLDAFLAPDRHRNAFMGHCWLVAPVYYWAEKTWGMTIFDRQGGQLYILDCQGEDYASQRVKGCVDLWIRFLNHVGFPNDFQYVAKVSKANAGIRTGPACVYWLMRMLRDQVGPKIEPTHPDVTRQDYLLGRVPQRPGPPASFSLLLPDWTPPHTTSRTAPRQVTLIICAVICNELGIGQDTVFRYGDLRLPSGRLVVPAKYMQEITSHANPTSGNIDVPSADFWTGQGGPQFFVSRQNNLMDIEPYNGKGPPRRNYRNSSQQTFEIVNNAQELQHRTKQTVVWRTDTAFDSENTFDKVSNGVVLQPSGLVPLNDKDTATTRNISLSLEDMTRAQRHVLNDLSIFLNNLTFSVQTNNGPVLQFDLEVNGGPDTQSYSTLITFPLPDVIDVVDDGGNGYNFGNNNNVTNTENDSNNSNSGNTSNTGSPGSTGNFGNIGITANTTFTADSSNTVYAADTANTSSSSTGIGGGDGTGTTNGGNNGGSAPTAFMTTSTPRGIHNALAQGPSTFSLPIRLSERQRQLHHTREARSSQASRASLPPKVKKPRLG